MIEASSRRQEESESIRVVPTCDSRDLIVELDDVCASGIEHHCNARRIDLSSP